MAAPAWDGRVRRTDQIRRLDARRANSTDKTALPSVPRKVNSAFIERLGGGAISAGAAQELPLASFLKKGPSAKRQWEKLAIAVLKPYMIVLFCALKILLFMKNVCSVAFVKCN